MLLMYLCLQTYYVMFVKCPHPYLFLRVSPPHPDRMLSLKNFLNFHEQLMITPRKSVFYDYNYEYQGVSLQASFSFLIALLFHVVLNFQSTKMILIFNIFTILNLITLTYTKCYTNLSRDLTNYINQQKYFLIWLFNCFYLCQSLKLLG